MERFVRHLLVFALAALLLGTNFLRLLVRYLNEDYQVTDIYYHVRNNQDVPLDENIVLVNIGNLDRQGMAKQLFKIAQYKPKVIALDVFFEGARDTLSDGMMQYVLANTPNVVLISLVKEDSLKKQSLNLPFQPFADYSLNGIGENLLEGGVGRKFKKQYVFENADTVLHFATQIAMLYDTAVTTAFLKREYEEEYIYFRGNISSLDAPEPSKFTVLDVEDVATENFTPDIIEGKIVMMGYLGNQAGDPFSAEDKFYSPLNKELSIRTLPDMFGVVFHANIVSMILSGQYVHHLNKSGEIGFFIGIMAFNICIFLWLLYYKRTRNWYAVISSVIIAIELAVYPFICVYLFTEYRYLLDLTYTLFFVLLSGYITKVYIYGAIKAKIKSEKPAVFSDSGTF